MSATAWSMRARAELERRRRARIQPRQSLSELYAFDPAAYIREKLGWTPWQGSPGAAGQAEVLEAYTLALRQQHERLAWEHGELAADELEVWSPGQVIQNWIRVEAGHTVGKTKIASGIVSHFFDCFVPSLGYAFAPSGEQINDLLFKEIRADRQGRGLPGRVLEGKPEMKRSADHFVKGRATNNVRGTGTERIQGQHSSHLIFVLDEAEGVQDFVWDGMESMTSGGIVIVLMLANPRTRISRFHKARTLANVKSFRISSIQHPNVVAGRELIPGAVRREWVETMVEKNCDVVGAHEPDEFTFELPWPVHTKRGVLPPGTIFRPLPEFMWRVMGRAPANLADDTFVPVGRYEAACRRTAQEQEPWKARLGLDVARYGRDYGTLYVRHNGAAWRAGRFAKKDTNAYARGVKYVALELAKRNVTSLHVRIDGGGGFGGGVIDKVKIDAELLAAFDDFQVLEVHNNGEPHDADAYADLGAEMYAEAAETLRGIAVLEAPDPLEADLCERRFRWVNRSGKDVRQLEPKEKFKADHKRSPDDGDGFCLAVAPDFIFSDRAGRVGFSSLSM